MDQEVITITPLVISNVILVMSYLVVTLGLVSVMGDGVVVVPVVEGVSNDFNYMHGHRLLKTYLIM